MLSDLVRGAAPASEPAGSTGLSGLVRGAAARPMSLPAAMNALKAGTLQRPADGAIGEVLAPDMPAQPAPRPLPYRGEVDEDEVRARVDRMEMQARIQRRRDELQASAAYTNDPRANLADSRRRYEITARLDEAERELTKMEKPTEVENG